MRTRLSPRLSIVACVAALAAAGCSQSPDTMSAISPSSLGATTEAKAGGPPNLNAELAAVRAATSQFHNVGAAVAAGYLPPEAGCVESPAGAMGVHSANPSLAQDQSVDPLRPEVLLYLPMPGGTLRLVGVEYMMTALVRNPTTQAVSPWFAPQLPAGYTVVTPRPQLFGQSFDGPMPGHEPGMPWHYDLHVWVWQPNPSGMFAQFNPSISCANAGD